MDSAINAIHPQLLKILGGTLKKIFLLFLLLLGLSAIILSCNTFQTVDDKVKISPLEWEDGTVKRDYAVMDNNSLAEELRLYDTEKPFLEVIPGKSGHYIVKAKLRNRSWQKQITVKDTDFFNKLELILLGCVIGLFVALVFYLMKGFR